MLESADASLFIAVGLRAARGRRDWLAREIVTGQPASTSLVFEVRPVDARVGLQTVSTAEAASPGHGLLLLGTGGSRGRIGVLVIGADGLVSADEVSIVGPGMHRIDLRPHASDLTVATANGTPARADDLERWSRTIGALGGDDVWRRLTSLRVTVIGAGRTGSLVARGLAGAGIRHLTLIDPDLVELHNIGESDGLHSRDIGLPKAVAVSRHLRDEFSGRDRLVNGLHGSVWDDRGIEIAKQSDVIVSCVDRDAPRLASALIATAHHRVLIDIGTGVLPEDSETAPSLDRRTGIGADVRVILPGEGCLLCRGGLIDYGRAVRELAGAAATPEESSERGTFGRRLGSLRSLNMVAAGAALRLLEGIVAGHGHGGWMHLADDGTGRFNIDYPEPGERRTDCRLCQRAGLGDAAI